MSLKWFSLAVGAVLVVSAADAALAQGADPMNGPWVLNLAKSEYSPGPGPKSTTVKIEVSASAVKLIVDSTPPEGKPVHYEASGKFGGEITFTGTNPNADTIVFKRINPTTIEATSKKGGKLMTTGSWVVSANGKTRTNTTKGTNAQRQAVNNILVYDKKAAGAM